MKGFVSSAPSQLGDACLALANLACDKQLGVSSVIESGGLKALTAAVHAHARQEPKLREWAAAALANLSNSSVEDVRDALVDGGAPRAAKLVLAACDETEHRTLRCCLAVWAALGRDDDGSDACCAAGLVEESVKAVLAIAQSGAQSAAEVAEEACRAYATLAFGDAAGRARLREAGVQRALTVALECFPRHAPLQEMGRALLSEISHS